MIYIGIDPGKAGGIAALTEGGQVLETYKMPEEPDGLVDVIASILGYRPVEGPAIVMLEFVSASPQMGVVSAFTFGKGYGRIEGVLAGANLQAERVHPVKWQNAMDCRTRGDKNISKAMASSLFPKLTITHAIADALLIAEYARRRGVPAVTR